MTMTFREWYATDKRSAAKFFVYVLSMVVLVLAGSFYLAQRQTAKQEQVNRIERFAYKCAIGEWPPEPEAAKQP